MLSNTVSSHRAHCCTNNALDICSGVLGLNLGQGNGCLEWWRISYFTQPSAFFRVTSPRCRAMASPISFLQASVFPAIAFQFSIRNNFRASLQTASFQLFLGFPTDLLPVKHPLLFVESSFFTTWPAHCNLFRWNSVGMPHAHTVCRSLNSCTLPWLAWLRLSSWGFSFQEGWSYWPLAGKDSIFHYRIGHWCGQGVAK
jgi:hypothetical protein